MKLIKELLESNGISVVANKNSKNKEMFTVKLKGEPIGSVWQDDDSWSAEYDATGASWDSLDSKQDAVDKVTDQLNESSNEYATTENEQARMRNMLDVLEQNIDRLGTQLSAQSQLAKLIAKVGGDERHFKSIVKDFDSLHENVHDLVKYTIIHMSDED
jgi:septal ring factor EnvC (AmiA/AmiB activator)